jgi:competence protein ComEC
VQSLSAGDQISIDPAMQLYIYGPSSGNHHTDPNEHSLVMELIYGQTEFLFTGDAGIAQEERVLSNFGDMLNTDLLKVGHHGSRTSSSKALLKSATPEYATVSLARNNKFKHPHPEAIERLSNSETELLFTSLEGALMFESDGERIERIKWRE